ncbi:MAG: hypothetical protein K6E49_08590 [Lachnospiraceae bacterium]|nr:hypothetical protein [Lachnospiraceae bacterium]
MNDIVKDTIELTCTAVLAIILLLYAGKIMDPFEAEYGLEAIKAFHMIENDSCDVIVYGSSHSWKGCDTRVMHDKYGIDVYNYGCNWQNSDTTLLFLKDSFRTQKPKLVCIETYTLPRERMVDMDMDGQIYYTRAMSWFRGKWEYLHKCFKNDLERYASYILPIIVFHDNWDKITEESFRPSNPERFVKNLGFFDNDEIWEEGEINLVPKKENQADLPMETIEILDEISKLCREHNVQVMLYTVPYEGSEPFKDAIQKYADDNQMTYLDLFDFPDKLGLDPATDLSDPRHLNKNGAAKVGNVLGEFIAYSYGIGNLQN